MNNEERILALLEQLTCEASEIKADVSGLKTEVSRIKADVSGLSLIHI